MKGELTNKHVLVGITGSIAAYKSADLVRRLKEQGAVVRVAMTENAKRFITPLTMQAVSGFPVHDDLFDPVAEAAMGHIELARWADVIVIAPASADFMARLATGQANDLLTTLCLATRAPIVVVPAMNQGMWQNPLTQANGLTLQQKGIQVLETAEGSQACGDVGPGRMLEPAAIIEKLSAVFNTGTLNGLRVVITAGPTREFIDPIRYISNYSSGKMGYALAEAAVAAGASVCLISGPVHLSPPARVQCIQVTTAVEMHQAVMSEMEDCAIFIATAAVSDYRVETASPQKLHKTASTLQLNFVLNPDIVSEVAVQKNKPFIVGFAAETEMVLPQAERKRTLKKMDLIVANEVGLGKGMGMDENEVTVLSANKKIHLPLASKRQLATHLIDMIATEFKQRSTS